MAILAVAMTIVYILISGFLVVSLEDAKNKISFGLILLAKIVELILVAVFLFNMSGIQTLWIGVLVSSLLAVIHIAVSGWSVMAMSDGGEFLPGAMKFMEFLLVAWLISTAL
jgi:hypothetical protein